MEHYEKYTTFFIEKITSFGPKLLSSLLILFFGLWLIKTIIKLVRRALKKQSFDKTIATFLLNVISVILKILLGIIILSQLGVAATSLAALVGAMGLAVGLSLQGSLSNFAGGFLIVLFKPFRVGDWIEAQGVGGRVLEIKIFTTHLLGINNKTHIIPNGVLSNNSIVNFTTEKILRSDVLVGISYDASIQDARKVLLSLMEENKKVLQEPKPAVVVTNLGNSSIELSVRAWVESDDYWDVAFEIREKIKTALDTVDIGIPFPQSVVHLHNKEK